MGSEKPRPTVDEIYALLKKTELPTVLVEGKDDIIFYRAIENELGKLEVDMLPAGNKQAVLALREKIKAHPIAMPIVFIVDKDLWVHSEVTYPNDIEDVITTSGYSIENDLFRDGELEILMTPDERKIFKEELIKFSRWYALALSRNFKGIESSFRTNPGKVLDDSSFYDQEIALHKDEDYPEPIFTQITAEYQHYLRGKSLFSLLLRQLAASKRDVKFGSKQLMWIGASRKGANFERIKLAVATALGKTQEEPLAA